MTRTIAVVSAGLRSPSTTKMLAEDLGERVRDELGGAEIVQVELRVHAHALADALLTGFPTGALKEAIATVVGADALIVVSPTFSASYSGLFKTFFDVIDPEALAGKPVLLAATGGTERHSLMLEHALRPLFTYLRTEPVATAVYAATSDFGGAGSPGLAARSARAAAQLARAVQGGPRAVGVGGAATTADPDLRGPGAGYVPFDQLLARR